MPDKTIEIDKNDTEEIKTEEIKKGIDRFSEESQTYIKELREESKTARLKLKEIEDKNADAVKLKLVEDGKLQELIEAQNTELETYKGIKETNDKNNEYFNKILETEVDGLSESIKEMILSSDKLTVEKIEMAKKIKSEQGTKSSSIGSESIGSITTTVQDDSVAKEFRDLKTSKERSAYMMQLEATNPELLKKLKEKIR